MPKATQIRMWQPATKWSEQTGTVARPGSGMRSALRLAQGFAWPDAGHCLDRVRRRLVAGLRRPGDEQPVRAQSEDGSHPAQLPNGR